MKPLISVIVPIYKVEEYLRPCVDSILSQTYTNLEIILVDDGSPDNCGAICDEYAAKDSRIRVIHKENGGISAARNAGLNISTGDYLCFIDSDDYVDKDFFETLHSAGDADVIASGIRTITKDGILLHESSPDSALLVGNESIKNAYKHGDVSASFYGPVAKLYSKSVAPTLRFDDEMAVGEDIVYNLNFLSNVQSAIILSFIGYNVRSHSQSTTHRLQQKYSPLLEHSYTLIDRKIHEAKINWGIITEEELKEGRTDLRYYFEVSNLIKSGTPYCSAAVRQKILEIHKDEDFLRSIRRSSFAELSNAGRISKLSVMINCPLITEVMFRILNLLGK